MAEPIQVLRDWALRVDGYLHEAQVGPLSWMIYRPHRAADEALLRLSVEYGHLVRELRESVAEADGYRDQIEHDETAVEGLADAIEVLLCRINTAVDILAEAGTMPQTGANTANTAKLFPGGVPDNPDIVDLVAQLDHAKGGDKSERQIAREFTGETGNLDRKAQSLLSQIRRLKREGRISL